MTLGGAKIYCALDHFKDTKDKIALLTSPQRELISQIMPTHMLGDMLMVIPRSQFPHLDKPIKTGGQNKQSAKRKPHDSVAYRYMDPTYQISKAAESSARVQSFTAVHYPTLPHEQAEKRVNHLKKECKLCWDHRPDLKDKGHLVRRAFEYRLSWLIDSYDGHWGLRRAGSIRRRGPNLETRKTA
jgi:hypothetical protein